MRAIWACIMLLIVGASVILIMRYVETHGGADAPIVTAIAGAGTSNAPREAATEPVVPVRDPAPVEPEPDPTPVEPKPDPTPVEPDPVPVENDSPDDPPAGDDETPMVATGDGDAETETETETDTETETETDTDTETETETETETDTETTDDPAAETTEAVTLGDRFTIPGSGTEADPYQVTWDFLISASESYKPRDGMEEIPDWIMAMHDKHVQITGYVLIPMGALSTTELLVMLNMWDGCCIGVPPSAYDAVEVGLTEPFSAKSGHQLFNYGAITGKLTVDPYLVNGWLMGLYLIEGGTFRPVDM